MKNQIMNRLGIAHVRDTVAQLVAGTMDFEQAMASLEIGKSRLYELRAEYLSARARGLASEWTPGLSGGNRKGVWPAEVQRFLRRVLSPDGDMRRYSYAFAASEVGRKFGHSVDRAQVRLWAQAHGIKIAVPRPRPPVHVRRWQRDAVGELWQLDATPDHFLGRDRPVSHLLDMLDDHSRLQVGCRIYAREDVPAYLDFLKHSFEKHGLPLEIYVDRAGFFRNGTGEPTQLARRLAFVGVSFVFANSPESKGKVERVHQVWQDRLVAYFAREGMLDEPMCVLNAEIERLLDYRNAYEIHRDIAQTPRAAWERAVDEGRNKLRPVPDDGWWELVWSQWSRAMVGRRGRIPLEGGRFCSTECANGTWVWLCRHVDGSVSAVLNKPSHEEGPRVVFSSNPHVNRSRR